MAARFAHLVFLGFAPGALGPDSWARVDAVAARRTLVAPGRGAAEALRDADGLLLALGVRAERALIDSAPRLRYIGVFGTGMGDVDAVHAAARGIAVGNVADYSTRAVAEFVIGILVAEARELGRARAEVAAGRYSEAGFTGWEIGGATVGVIGLGRIGRRVAHIAHAGLGAEVIYWSRASRSDEPGIAYAERLDVLARARVVGVHLAHTPDTEGLLDAEAFEAMRPDAVVVNAAPMALVDLPALERALERETFSFVLDHPEGLPPDVLARLVGRPNCAVYPSLGYRTAEAARAKEEIFVRGIEAAAAGGG